MISADREPAATVVPAAAPAGTQRKSGFVADLLSLVVLGGISLAVGLSLNVWRSKPLPWRYETREQRLETAVQRVSANQPAEVTPDPEPALPPHEIRLDDFQKFVAERKGLVLDTRPAMFYGEGHVPGAVNLPNEAFEETYPRLKAALEPRKDREIAIYCSGADCPDAELLAEALTKLGYRRLLIYTSGWDEWSQTGLPQEKGAPQL